MRFTRILAPVLGAATLCLTVSPTARADAWDRKTVVTFDQDTQIPGSVLPAGTYVFKLLRGGVSDRFTVQIWDGTESHLLPCCAPFPRSAMKFLIAHTSPSTIATPPRDFRRYFGVGSIPATIPDGRSSMRGASGGQPITALP
jgi:hypothetical protein